MRFEAKKKGLSNAAKVVRSMSDALAATNGPPIIHVIAEGKAVKLRAASGGQIVESIIGSDVVVQEAGSVAIDATALANALSVGGDNFKASLDGNYLVFACGRSKGRLEVKQGVDNDDSDAPKPTTRIPGFKALLRAITLKGTNKGERTLHFDSKGKTVRGESTDAFRGITTVAPLASGEKLPGSASISLPAKAMDALGQLVEDCLIGFDEKFFSIRSPGLFVSLPQSTTPPVDIAEQLEGWLGGQEQHATFTVPIKEIKEAIADAIAISTDKSGSRLTVSLGPDGGKMLGEGDAGRVETEFTIVSTDATKGFDAQVVPNFLRECLDFYSGHENVKVDVYTTALVLNQVESNDLLTKQTTAIPLLAEVTIQEVKAKKAKAPAEEDSKPAKKSPPAKAADEDDPVAPKKPAKKPVVESEDEDEPPAKPVKKSRAAADEDEPVAPKKPAKKPVVEPEDDEYDDEDDEDFDDEE